MRKSDWFKALRNIASSDSAASFAKSRRRHRRQPTSLSAEIRQALKASVVAEELEDRTLLSQLAGSPADYRYAFVANGSGNTVLRATLIADSTTSDVSGVNTITFTSSAASVRLVPPTAGNYTGGYASISSALTAASAGDTVVVGVGTFSENILVNKSLTLLGAQAGVKAAGTARSGGETTIDGTGGSSSFVVTIEADNVTIDGFKVELRDLARDGINTRAASSGRSNITLKNNWIYANLPSRTNSFNGIVFGEHTSNTAQSSSSVYASVRVERNYIDLISTSSNATPSSTSITGARGLVFTNMFRNGTAELVYSNLLVDDNTIYATYNSILQAQIRTRMTAATFTNNVIGNSRSGVNLPTLTAGSVFSNNIIEDIDCRTDYYSNQAGAVLGVVDSTVANNTFRRITGVAALVLSGGRSADATYYPPSANSTVSGNTITYNSNATVPSTVPYIAAVMLEPDTTSAAVNVGGVLVARLGGVQGVNANSITFSGNTIVNSGSQSAVPAVPILQMSVGTRLNIANATPNVIEGTTLDAQTGTTSLYALANRIADSVDSAQLGTVVLRSGNIYVTENSTLPTVPATTSATAITPTTAPSTTNTVIISIARSR